MDVLKFCQPLTDNAIDVRFHSAHVVNQRSDMTVPANEIKCTDRQLAIFGLALKELNATERPIINRLKQLEVDYSELAGIAVGKIWKLILEGDFNTQTLKMQINRMWPTQVDAHMDLIKKAYFATGNVTTEWGLLAVDTDYEIKSFHKHLQSWVEEYNKIGKLKLTDDELHARFRRSCREFLPKLNDIYTEKKAENTIVKRLGI